MVITQFHIKEDAICRMFPIGDDVFGLEFKSISGKEDCSSDYVVVRKDTRIAQELFKGVFVLNKMRKYLVYDSGHKLVLEIGYPSLPPVYSIKNTFKKRIV